MSVCTTEIGHEHNLLIMCIHFWNFDVEAPPVAQSALLQNIFPDKPLSIQIGNRSFQPTAKFETVDEAMPANPLATGFSRCHEKALVYTEIYLP